MNTRRRLQLECTEAELTEEELAQGYHFCIAWDGLVVGPDDPEAETCTCGLFDKEGADNGASF